MLKRERMMPVYQDVRTGQGDFSPLGRMGGQEPVEVRTPARRADWVGFFCQRRNWLGSGIFLPWDTSDELRCYGVV